MFSESSSEHHSPASTPTWLLLAPRTQAQIFACSSLPRTPHNLARADVISHTPPAMFGCILSMWPFFVSGFTCAIPWLEHSALFASHRLPLVDSYSFFIAQVKRYFPDTRLPSLPHNKARTFSPISCIYCHSSLHLSSEKHVVFRSVYELLGYSFDQIIKSCLCCHSVITNPTPGTASWPQVAGMVTAWFIARLGQSIVDSWTTQFWTMWVHLY